MGRSKWILGPQKRKTNMKPHFEINNKFFHIHLFPIPARSNKFGKRDIRLVIDTKLFHLLFTLKTILNYKRKYSWPQ
jgi:hypothetical protein